MTHTAPTRGWTLPDVPDLQKDTWQPLLDAFKDADNLGSLITPPELDYDRLEEQLGKFEASGRQEVSADAPKLRKVLGQARLLAKRYSAVVANPPYMGSSSFNKGIKDFVLKNYKEGKQDLYGVYILRNLELSALNGIVSMITIPNWMFLSSFEGLRDILLSTSFVESMVHNGRGVFGSDFGSCSFTIRKSPNKDKAGTYKRLFDKHVNVATNEELEKRFFERSPHYAKSSDFEKIPGSPIAYWVSERVLEAFDTSALLRDLATPRQGLATAQNDRFLRIWYETNHGQIGFGLHNRADAQESGAKWFPYNKGGDFRKWYGNQEFVVNWQNDGEEIRSFGTEDGGRPRSRAQNTETYFRESASWTKVTSGGFALRYFPPGFIYDVAGCSLFSEQENALNTLLGTLNSKLVEPLVSSLAPTLNFEVGQVASVPIINTQDEIYLDQQETVRRCIEISKSDWDNFETSWDFQTHPLLRHNTPHLSTAFDCWHKTAEAAFYELKGLEEENNRYWIEAYGLENELAPDVPEDQITIRRADKERDVKSLLSYAVGCMMGRYSLSQPGLQFAGGTFDLSQFEGDTLGGFMPDEDGIIPVTDEAYFGDDIVTRFVAFLKVAFGEAHLGENLAFVADALSRRANESALERIRRYFVSEFVTDHARTYSKRPVYWLFTSGKENAFGGLVYLHRYTPETLARMRNDYVLPLQSKLEAEVSGAESAVEEAASGSARKAAQKRLAQLQAQVAELLSFQDRLQHYADKKIDLDLDDGVAYNYTRFAGDETGKGAVDGIIYKDGYLKMESAL